MQRTVYLLPRDVVFMQAIVNTFISLWWCAGAGRPGLGSCAPHQSATERHQPVPCHLLMPVVVSIVVVSLLCASSMTATAGPNNLLKSLTSAHSRRSTGSAAADGIGSIIVMSIWQAVGFHMVIWLSGLQTDQPDAVRGCGHRRRQQLAGFRYVTWPGLRNTAVLVLIVITCRRSRCFRRST